MCIYIHIFTYLIYDAHLIVYSGLFLLYWVHTLLHRSSKNSFCLTLGESDGQLSQWNSPRLKSSKKKTHSSRVMISGGFGSETFRSTGYFVNIKYMMLMMYVPLDSLQMKRFVASLVLNGRSLVHFAYEETNRSQTIPQFAPCSGRRLRMVHLSSVLPIEARGSYDLTVVTVVQDDLFSKLMKPI